MHKINTLSRSTATWKAALLLLMAWASCPGISARAEVRLSNVFGDHMVLQRDKPIAVFGSASAGERVSVSFGGKNASATADAHGSWQVLLPALHENIIGRPMNVAGSNVIKINDVLVGDVWLCSGQSNMDMALGGCNRKEDLDSASLPGIRSLRVPIQAAEVPAKTLKDDARWMVCTPQTAAGFSATAFYFARKIYLENHATIPIGLVVASVGGTPIDLWLSPEGLVDVPVLKPLLLRPAMPDGPFRFSNGMIAPLAPYGIKGAIWYQGENAEQSVQSPDSYFLKMKAMVQGWKRLWAMDDFPFYYVMIANWGEKPKEAAPVLHSGGWSADTRLQQARAMAISHAGCASAMDVGDSSMGARTWDGWHPKDKLDVGERLALWALKNDYGHPEIVASGPNLKDVEVLGNTIVCSFDDLGSGLMVGSKKWYKPTEEVAGSKLYGFVIAGNDSRWQAATANIQGNKVILSSPAIAEPHKVSYACWQNPEGCNLYNKEGLPALPFYVEDVTRHYSITAQAGIGGCISPPGTRRFVTSMTALYTITPSPGYYVQDVKLDGKSVGSVCNYTFDPIHSDHVLEANFSKEAPSYTITATVGNGGAIVPSGAVTVRQGETKTFTIEPTAGVYPKSLTVDGTKISSQANFTFSDIRRDHSIAATFACKIEAEAGFGGSIAPCGEVLSDFGGSQTFKIRPIPGYSIASITVDGSKTETPRTDSFEFDNINKSHALSVRFEGGPPAAGKIPQTGQLIFACLAQSLPAEGTSGAWRTLFPAGGKLTPIAAPTTRKIAGKSYSRNRYLAGDGHSFQTYARPIACNGATIVAVARPVRNGANSGWNSIVDVFYDRLTLGIRNDSGRICVRRNGPIDLSETAIPDGRVTVLSLIVQPDGSYRVYANGAEVMAKSSTSPMTSLVPGEAAFAKSITVGRNAPDGWTAFNGDIGDVFFYKIALTDEERKDLEAYIEHKLNDSDENRK
jgi:sialate O-acetylesterase